MRFPYMLLAFAASVTADNTAQSRRSDETGLTLESRKPVEASQMLEARHSWFEDTTVPLPAICDPESPMRDHEKCQQTKNPEGDNGEGEDDDEKHDHKGGDNDEKHHGGGVIAGAVIGSLIALLFLLTMWYCFRIRPNRRARILEQRRKADELENGYGFSPPGTHQPTPAVQPMPGSQNPSQQNVRFQPTPYPGNVPSPSVTNSSMSGLALPTPALTYSPSVTSTTASPLSPLPAHALADKPPAYVAVAALQSSEPQPEASAYQMGQTPMPMDPPLYHLTEEPRPAIMDIKGEHLPRY
ncbi:hypothetical protein Daesc_010144 [Daldinia eschscholtzii]|uniref:Uncharacterized protein n=1 Tax=Daldinia eschscholtzii TaxID=292717 RepID=A0AAX6M6V6_9PEZI